MSVTEARENVREAILDAAERLLVRYGYRKTTMEDLAREAGIGKGTVYLYFSSKEEVALSAIDRLNERIMERLRAIARNTNDSPVQRIRKMLVTRVLLRFDSVQDFTQSLDEIFAAIRFSLLARRVRYNNLEAQIFAEVLIEGRLLGWFECEDALQTAYTLLWATNSLMPSNLTPNELGRREEIKDIATRIAELLLRGLLRREAAPASGA